MTALVSEIRYARRSLARSPGWTLAAVATLALGIGANTAIFSVVDAVLLRPLPYRNPDRLVAIWSGLNRPGLEKIMVSAPELHDLRAGTHVFKAIAAYDEEGVNLTGNGEPERLSGAYVSPGIFSVLGARAELGRVLVPRESRPGRSSVVVLSHALWRRRFGGDPGLLDKHILLDGQPVTPVGVMPKGFRIPGSDSELWMPLVIAPELMTENNRGSHFLTVVARMKAGVSLARARADVAGIARQIGHDHPETYRSGYTASVTSWRDEIVGDSRLALLVLAGAVALVLLIACANVAGLQLARAIARRRELAIRAALGAGRGQLFAHSFAESGLVALAGGAAGLALAWSATNPLLALAPADIPRLADVRFDAGVLAFTALVSLLTGVLFGAIPARQAARARVSAMLREGGSGAMSGSSGRSRQALVVAECSLALILMAGAGLLLRSFERVREVHPGFRVERRLSFRLLLPEARYPDFARQASFFAQALARLSALPGIRATGAINLLPLSGHSGDRSFRIEGRPSDRSNVPDEELRFASADYFQTMSIPLHEGRFFTSRDDASSPGVAIVDEALERRYWPGQSAIGKRISFRGPKDSNAEWREVVGVVGSVHHGGLDSVERPELYVPFRQPLFSGTSRMPALYFVVETEKEPMRMLPAVRSAIASLDPDEPLSDVRTMAERLASSTAGRRFSTLLVGGFAWLALGLAAVGIFGLVAHSVSQRAPEIALRQALGASPGQAAALVVRQGILLVGAGIVIGCAGALLLTRTMSGLLFGVAPTDPATFAGVVALLAAVGLAACVLPARRAAKTDPMEALRAE
jgi:putative ABC transport system permease protein